MTQEKQNQKPVSARFARFARRARQAKAGQENCPLCEVSPETIEKLKNQSKEQQNKEVRKKNFWQKLFTPRHSEAEGRRIPN